jgi:hypothetical protein
MNYVGFAVWKHGVFCIGSLHAQLLTPIFVCGLRPATNTCCNMEEMLIFQGRPPTTGADAGTVNTDDLKMQKGADARRTLATAV